MSPQMGTPVIIRAGFPRVSGDEPQINSASDAWLTFSPRERG
mgnify:CR=1 FL=1